MTARNYCLYILRTVHARILSLLSWASSGVSVGKESRSQREKKDRRVALLSSHPSCGMSMSSRPSFPSTGHFLQLDIHPRD